MTFSNGHINRGLVRAAWRPRQERDVWNLLMWPLRTLFRLTLWLCLNTFCSRTICPQHPELQQLSRAWQRSDRLLHTVPEGAINEFTDYEFVWLNTWLYCGTDNLWAAVIRSLTEGVERHYRPDYAHAEKRTAFIHAM